MESSQVYILLDNPEIRDLHVLKTNFLARMEDMWKAFVVA